MKHFFSILILATFLWSCGDDLEEISQEPTGSLKISYSLEPLETLLTRTSPSPFTIMVTLTDTSGKPSSMTLPEDGLITGLTPGNYTVYLSFTEADAHVPSFENYEYSGFTNVTVEDNVQKDVDVVCEQSNAGIYFTYDDSLSDAGLNNIIPSLKQNNETLEFSESHKNQRGYFDNGNIILTLLNDNDAVSIGEGNSHTIPYSKSKLTKIRLYVSPWNVEGSVNAEITTKDIETGETESKTAGVTADEIITFTQTKGVFFGDMITDDFDNFTFYMYTGDVVVTDLLVLEGVGYALILDLYVPVTGIPEIAPEHYQIKPMEDGKYHAEPGADYGGGMMTGSALCKLTEGNPDSVKEYFYLKSGDMFITKSGENYAVEGYLTDIDDNRFEIYYTGEFNVSNPFGL